MPQRHSKHADWVTRYAPFLLTVFIIALDQITKAVIVATVPRIENSGFTIRVIGDFLRIIHTRNTAVAFSLGSSLPPALRRVAFVAVPAIVLTGLLLYFVRTSELTRLGRWALAGILGGGAGNLIDRMFRPDGVVDFVDVKFYGIFGMERWPTFNVADATVVVCGLLLVAGIVFQRKPAALQASEATGEQED